MDSIRIDFDQIDWDDKSAGMRVKRLRRHGKRMRMIEIGPDSAIFDTQFRDFGICVGYRTRPRGICSRYRPEKGAGQRDCAANLHPINVRYRLARNMRRKSHKWPTIDPDR